MVSVSLPSDALSQHLPSHLGFSYFGRGVSLPGWSLPWTRLPLLTLTVEQLLFALLCPHSHCSLDMVLLLSSAAPDLGHGVAHLGHHPDLGYGVAPLSHASTQSIIAGTVKQEMARMNIEILGISELKWTGMGEFNSDDHYIYYCGQESLRRNGLAVTVNKRI